MFFVANASFQVWMGDRWQHAPDGIKGHDPTYFEPLQFDSDGTIVPFGFEAAVTATVCNWTGRL